MLVLKTVINNLVALRGYLVVYCEQTISERTCFYKLFIFHFVSIVVSKHSLLQGSLFLSFHDYQDQERSMVQYRNR